MIDLNSDLGEGFGRWSAGDDAALLDVVTSASIACGFHAGDPAIMRRTCAAAAAGEVAIGAHVSYPDLVGFGRRAMAVPAAHVVDDCLYQIGALQAFARAAGTRVRYVKAHGALYHAAAVEPEIAEAVVAAAVGAGGLPVLGLPGSQLARAAEAAGIAFFAEGFADRAYTAAGALVPRSEAGSVLDAEAAVAQAVSIAVAGTVGTPGEESVAAGVRSVCVHGDSPAAVGMARAIRQALVAAGVTVSAFT